MSRKGMSKLISLCMAGILSLGLISGCSGTTSSSSSSGGQTDSGSSSSEQSDGNASGERTVLRVEVFDRAVQGGSNPIDNHWTKWINEQMIARHNMEIQFVSVPRSEEIQQLNVLMASGDAPDIVFTYTQSVVYNYYKQGGVADLTDYIEQYGSNITGYLGDEVLSYGRFDDRQYIIPAKRISRATNGTYMRKDWLDALGLPEPTTMDEFYDTLVQFKEKNPGGVEQVIPYGAAADINAQFSGIIDSFLQLDGMTEEQRFVNAIDGNEKMMYPGFKESIQFINKMYNAGLVDPQFPLYKDGSPTDDLISRGMVGTFNFNYDYPMRTTPGVYNNLKTNIPTAELIAVDCMAMEKGGKAQKQIYLPSGIYNFVPASSKNIEGAVKYLDFLCEEEVRTYLTCGEEGVNHTLDEEGIPVMINLQNDERMMNSPNNLDYAAIVNGVDLGDEARNIKVLSKSYEPGYEELFTQAYNIAMKDSFVVNSMIVPFESEAQFSANLKEKAKEVLASAITASEANFDSVYDAGIQEWLAVGGQQCLDERQAYWDSIQ